MIIVNGWKPLTIITKRSILDVAAVLDPPLVLVLFIRISQQIVSVNKKIFRCEHHKLISIILTLSLTVHRWAGNKTAPPSILKGTERIKKIH